MGTVPELMAMGDAIFDAVFGMFDAMISGLTGGLVTDYLSGTATLDDMTDRILNNLRDRSIELVEDVSTTIAKATSQLTNNIARNFADVLGITALQQRIAENFAREMEARISLYEKEGELVETEEAAAAKALSERLMQTISDRSELYMDQYNLHMARIIDLGDEESREFSETSLAGLEMAKSLLDIDYRMIADVAEERNVAAVVGMGVEIEETIASADKWALEVGVKPLAYGEMAMNVLAKMLDIDPEELEEQLRMITQASYKLAGDMIPTFKPGVE